MAQLIFLHGFPFNGSAWQPQLDHFKGQHQMLAPDLRGHRDGPSGPGPWMMGHFTQDLLAILDAHKIARATLCGLSMGGYVALHFAAQHPERVEALVLCDTRPEADSNETKDKRFAAIQRLQQEGAQGFARDFTRQALSEHSQRTQPQLVTQVEAMILGNQAPHMAMLLGALASRHDHSSLLPKIGCPTQVIVGEADAITSVDVNAAMARQISGARFASLPNAGHLSNLEAPAAFNTVLADFLQR